jgi:hypothetical protein
MFKDQRKSLSLLNLGLDLNKKDVSRFFIFTLVNESTLSYHKQTNKKCLILFFTYMKISHLALLGYLSASDLR